MLGFPGMANPQTDRPPSLNKPEASSARQVGRYTVVRHLASGGMAELFIARQEAMGGFEKQVVLKMLQPRYAENPRVVTMFLDEARLAAKLNHPAIVHVYDVAEDGGLKYIAMEYIHGETVADIVKRGLAVNNYLPLEHAVHIVRQTAAGLAYAHERREPDGNVLRIVHRDVSPTNILVSYEGQTKIVDFGIARAQDELREESGTRPGKASYMSPEQVRGEPADYRSDIFSLGIILYELTLCQRLYRGAPEAMMRQIVEEKVHAADRDQPRLSADAGADRDAGAGEAPGRSLPVGRGDEPRPGGVPGRKRPAQRQPAHGRIYMHELFATGAPASESGRQCRGRPPSRGQPARAARATMIWKSWTSIAARRSRCASRSRPSPLRRPPRQLGRVRPAGYGPRRAADRSGRPAPTPAQPHRPGRRRRQERPFDASTAKPARRKLGHASPVCIAIGIAAMVIMTLK